MCHFAVIKLSSSFFSQQTRPTTLIFEPKRRYTISRETPFAEALNTVDENISVFRQGVISRNILETVRDKPIDRWYVV